MSDQSPLLDETTSMVVARPVDYAPAATRQHELKMLGVRHRDALLDLTIILMASIVLPYLPSFLMPLGSEATGLPGVGLMVVVHKWCEAGLACGLLAYFVLRHRIRPAAFGLRSNRVWRQLLWGIVTLAGMYAALFFGCAVVLTLLLLFPELRTELAQRIKFISAMPVNSLATTIVLLVAVAIHEEVLFRGLLLPYLRRVLGSWWSAVLVSVVIFALLHVPGQGLLSGAQIFGIGVVLSVFYILSRSLVAVSLAHLLFDFFQFRIFHAMPNPNELLESLGP